MKLLRPFIAAGLLLAAMALPAEASLVRVCAPDRAGAALGPRPVTAPSGTIYNLNSRGCALVSFADAAGLTSALGFLVDPGVLTITAANASPTFTMPPGGYIDSITVREVSGGAVIGGLRAGTTAGGTQVFSWNTTGAVNSTATLAGASLTHIPDVSMLKRAFSSTSPQQVFMDAVGNWNGGAVDITVHYSFF